ncbi:MAG: P1 family peptidase [Pseudomonadota bacterium]
MYHAITDIEGIEVGHWSNLEAGTGCTVVLCKQGAVGGVDVRGSAPGTRETDLMRPMNLVQKVHAVILSGGSAFGLDAAGGVMRWLEERGIGFDVGLGVVPIVAAAVLFDLNIGQFHVRPGPEEGYAACEAADAGPVSEGSIGAGTGATVGKIMGPSFATKGGVGTAARRIGGGVTVGALVAVNAYGDIIDPSSGKIIAGARDPQSGGFLNTVERMQMESGQTGFGFPSNTTLSVIATDAVLSKEESNKLAQMAHDGLARAIQPIHTLLDGDTVFALATGKRTDSKVDLTVLGTVGARVVSEAVIRAVRQAASLYGIPSVRDLEKGAKCE